MNLGLEMVACALRDDTLRPFIDAGLTREYLLDEQDKSAVAVFGSGEDLRAWTTLLDHWDRHRKMPSLDLFRRSFTEAEYALPKSNYTADELVTLWRQERMVLLSELAASDIAKAVDEGEHEQAIDMLREFHRIITAVHENPSITVDWDSPDYDIEARIHRKVTEGVMTGIKGLDEQDGFYGYQPGNLICYLGRAKAGKTSFALLSAMNAWQNSKRVLFISFEIAAGKLPSEPGIADRLDCFGAGIDLIHYMMGDMTGEEQRKLREFRANEIDAYAEDSTFRIVQPTSRYTLTELEADVEKFKPDVVYIDGFYFMVDRITGKPGAHWEGHDNLAAELKKLGMNLLIPIIVSHQVREKQLTSKKGAGIDDQAMMGGTGIIMYADIVFGFDVDDDMLRTISCTRSRLKYLSTVYGTWQWSDCTFHESTPDFDSEQFGGTKSLAEEATHEARQRD